MKKELTLYYLYCYIHILLLFMNKRCWTIKYAMPHYASPVSFNYTVPPRKHLDRDINLGQVSVRPNHDKDGTIEGHTIFTNKGYIINVHNTTSRLEVNGTE